MTKDQDSIENLATAITEAAYTQASALDRMTQAGTNLTKAIEEHGHSIWLSLYAIAEAIDRHGAPLSSRSKAAADRVEERRHGG